MLGSPNNRRESPNTRVQNTIHTSHVSCERETKESPKVCSRLKSCEPLYTCPRAPFYREKKRLFTFWKYPRIKGIFLVCTCTKLPFTSRDLRGWFYIFTSSPLVHTSTLTFRSSVFDLASLWSLNFRPWLPNFGDLYLWFRRSETSEPY
jgi:hypothetical protein